jgi:plasmid stabilization system protein ParE
VSVVVSAPAAVDIERLGAFLADKNPDAARRAVAILTRAIDSLTTHPERGRPAGAGGMRELVVPFGQSAYIVRYAYDANRDEVVIIRIWHGREARA